MLYRPIYTNSCPLQFVGNSFIALPCDQDYILRTGERVTMETGWAFRVLNGASLCVDEIPVENISTTFIN